MKSLLHKRLKILLLLFILSMTTSCSLLGSLVNLAFAQPKVSIKSFSLDSYNTDSFNFKADLNVDNPNSIGIKTSTVDYNLDINNIQMINGVLTNGIDISAQKTSTVEIPIQINFQKVIQLIPTILTDINNIKYKVYGTVNFDTPIGPVPISWNQEDKLNIPSIFGK